MPNVDLQAVSIDPVSPQIKVGEVTDIVVVMKNNGPDAIPKTEATCQITLSAVHLGRPGKFQFHGKQWRLLGVITTLGKNGQHNIFMQNNAGPIPVDNEQVFGFSFKVKGKKAAPGPVHITLASSLSGTSISSDQDGNNQSVATEISVVK